MPRYSTDHAGLEILPFEECLRLLASVPVGRVGFIADGELVILPVNHVVDGHDVAFRTAHGSKLAATEGQHLATFEADHYNEQTHSGWSVVVTGRKTGRRYDIPVGYVDMEGKLTVVTVARWRVNLRGGADVEVTLRGHLRPMHALLDEDPASVAVSYQAVINRIGWTKAQRQLGISLPGGRAPTLVELNDAAGEYGWSVITLTPR